MVIAVRGTQGRQLEGGHASFWCLLHRKQCHFWLGSGFAWCRTPQVSLLLGGGKEQLLAPWGALALHSPSAASEVIRR